MQRRPGLVVMYKGRNPAILNYVNTHRDTLSSMYSVNLFDRSKLVLSPDGLELAIETISDPPANQSTWESITSETEITRKLAELVRSLKEKNPLK